MKVSNYGMINLMNTLDMFGNRKLPQKISYAITRNIMILSSEYECYEKSLKKIFDRYDEYFERDENSQIIVNDNGIPVVCAEKSEDFASELTELLNIEINIDIKHISLDVFDYDDISGKYDILTPQEIIMLQSILCHGEQK